MNRNLNDKSYNELMKQWAAQKNFLQRAASSLVRPGREVTGGVRFYSWAWRIAVLTGVPFLIYIGWLRIHGKSGEFTNQMAAQTKKFLNSGPVKFLKIRWDGNGELRLLRAEVEGGPNNWFSSMDLKNIDTFIPMPRVFYRAWDLEKVQCFEATVTLRAGSLPKQASAGNDPAVLAAGWGLNPDFARLKIGSYQADALTLKWGGQPSTQGVVTDSKAVLKPAEGAGWNLSLSGGTFKQCWLEGLKLTRGAVHIGADRADISEGDFTVAGGGSGIITGGLTFGEQPELDVTVKLENTDLQQFISAYFADYVKATGGGVVKLTGSTNRSSGILMDASLAVQSGQIFGVPVLRALEIATGESGLSALEITGGQAHVTSQGSSEASGMIVEADNISLECGTRLRIGFSVRHEHKEIFATSYNEAVKDPTTGLPEHTKATSTKGTVRIGLPPAAAAKLKPAIRQQFFVRDELGLQWMDIPFDLAEDDFTKTVADKIVALHMAKE